MKRLLSHLPRPQCPRTSLFGWVLSALGLLSGGFGVTRLAAMFAGMPVAPATLIVSLLVGLVVSAAGFSLLVVGSSPFDDETWPAVRDERAEDVWDHQTRRQPPPSSRHAHNDRPVEAVASGVYSPRDS